MGREHRPDRALVSGAVGMTPDVPENRAHVQTRAATNAVKGIALLRVSQQLRPLIIQQNHVKFFRAVHLIGLAGATDQRVVTGDLLAGPGRGQHGQEQRQIR